MNKLIASSILLALFLIFNGCQKDYHSSQRFIGSWVTTDLSDTMIFLTNTSIYRPHNNYYDLYGYSYTTDSITIHYTGPDKILVLPMVSKYLFVQDTLMINYKSNYYPTITKGLKKYLKNNYAVRQSSRLP